MANDTDDEASRGVTMSASRSDTRIRARLAGIFDGHKEAPCCLLPFPDRAHIITASSKEHDVALWRIHDQSLVRLLNIGPITVQSGLECDPTGSWVALGTENQGVYLFPVLPSSPSGAPLGHLPVSEVGMWPSLALIDQLLYIGRSDGAIQVWGGLPDAPRLLSTWNPPIPPPEKHLILHTQILAVDAPRRRLACQLPYIWGQDKAELLTVLRYSDEESAPFSTEFVVARSRDSYATTFSPDGIWLAVAETSSHSSPVRLVNTANRTERAFFPPDGWAIELAYSPDGRFLAVGGANGEIEIRSAVDGRLHSRFVAHANGWDWRDGPPSWALARLAWTPDSRYLLTAGGSDSTYEVKTGWNSGPADHSVKVWEIVWHEYTARRHEAQ